jgi:hypothetical protein
MAVRRVVFAAAWALALLGASECASPAEVSASLAAHIADFSAATPADTLAAIYLVTRPGKAEAEQTACAIRRLGRFLRGTPLQVYVFVGPNATIPETDAVVLPVPPESWTVPAYVRQDAHPEGAPREYRLMGWWRLTFQMEFAAAMGHAYVLQTDGDLFLTRPLVRGDLVAQLRSANASLASYCDPCSRDVPSVMRGLPEFSAWFLATRGLTPVGPVYQHTRPRDARGLYVSASAVMGGPRPREGFDLETLTGHFMILSLRFWATPIVADYVAAALRTGSIYEERWNEQALQTWVRFLFVPEAGLMLVGADAVVHRPNASLSAECEPDGIFSRT